MIARAAIIEEARQWIGTPFVHQQQLRGVGCDCIGLVSGVAQAVGLPEADRWRNDVRFRGYGREPVTAKLREAVAEYLDPVTGRPQPGDILLFKFNGLPMHFAILVRMAPDYIVHGFQPMGRVVENSVGDTWRRRFAGAFAYRGVA